MALPQNIQIPKKSQFMKLEQGENVFRILEDVKTGWCIWKDGKPERQEGDTCFYKIENADINKFGKPALNYFWIMAIWNYKTKKVETLEITQKTIMTPLFDLENNGKWGDLKNYDISITKKGSGNDTEFSVVPNPKEPLTDEIKKAFEDSEIDLSKLFKGEYPMTENETEKFNSKVDLGDGIPDTDISDIPF